MYRQEYNSNRSKYTLNQQKNYFLPKNANLRKVDLGKNFINCFNKNEQNNNLIIKDNKVFLNTVNETNKFGVNIGEYKLTNNNNDYPVGFICSSNIINVTDGIYVGSKFIDGVNVNFYTGDITFSVLEQFKNISIYFLNHGYLNGRNKLVFTNLCGNVSCVCDYYQSYSKPYSAVEERRCVLGNLWNNVLCQNAGNARVRKIINQQDLYTMMRLKP